MPTAAARGRLVLLAALLALLLALPVAAAAETIIDVATKSRADVARLADMGLDLAENAEIGATTVVARDGDIERIEQAGFTWRSNPMMGRVRLADRFGRAPDAGLYHTVEESAAELRALAKAHPKLARVEVIGKSIEKRDILALRIAGAPARRQAQQPKVLFMGLHHAREWIAAEVPHAIANELLGKYGKDPKITELVNGRVVYIVPVVNPDGLHWSQTSYSYWRKNRNPNGGGKYLGVDLNRNYGYKFGLTGASSSPGSDTYHGAGPFSEPCSQAVKALCEREKFTASVSYHSYGNLVLHPFGYGYNIPNPDQASFVRLARAMGGLTGYKAQNSAELYPAMGDSDDWLYGAMGILAFTFELGRQFVPNESEIAPICAANVKAALYLIEEAGKTVASNHPSRPDAVRGRIARLNELAREAARAAAPAVTAMTLERDGLCALLDPCADGDGARLEEYLKAWARFDETERSVQQSVLSEVKARTMAARDAGRIDAGDGARRLEKIKAALGE